MSTKNNKNSNCATATVSGCASQRTLNVKKTSVTEIAKEWGDTSLIPLHWTKVEIYIRCNAKGVVNWEIAPVYVASELFNRKVQIHD
ncbi:MAG: hypothetical protein JST78_09655 [Bacteroidetes bacterium]|nr:hypothetical protein [Bacteroidota bacterium]